MTQDNADSGTKDVGGVAGERLNSFIQRIERLESNKSEIMEDIKEVYAEAKGVGFDVKTIRKIVSLRKLDPQQRKEAQEILEMYTAALGMV